MIAILTPLLSFIGMFLLIILIVRLLKYRGVFDDSHQPVFDRLVTEFALPAIVFGLLTTTTFRAEWILPVLIVIGAVITTMFVAWGACRAFGFTPAATGTIVILSAFGSTYTLGSPVLTAIFGPLSEEVALGHVIGSFGFALPFFTLGILAAGYFGLKESGDHLTLPAFLKGFFTSPVFLAFWLGLLVSVLFSAFQLPGAEIYRDLFTEFFVVIQHAINLLTWISIGLLLRPVRLRLLLPALALVSVIHLAFLPALVFAGGSAASIPEMQLFVSTIMAALPSGAIAAVVSSRYGCDGKLASVIVICTCLFSLVTLPLFLFLVPVS